LHSKQYRRKGTGITRLLPLFLLIGSTMLFGQSPESSTPLNAEEKRLILIQLLDLKSCRATVETYEDQIAKERPFGERALEIERQATELARKERDLALEKARMFKQLYSSVKPGKTTFGCVLKTIFSEGLYRCK